MPKTQQNKSKNPVSKKPDSLFRITLRWLGLEPTKRIWLRRLLISLLALVLLVVGSMYGVARWYIAKHAHEPLVYGATFIPEYAESFGLDPKEVLSQTLNDLGIKRVRLVSYWDAYEKTQGTYNFDGLDWQFKMANEAGADVSLAIGLRQPRWPECHMPDWAASMPMEQWSKELNKFITTVVNRYKDNPNLVSYQLENEFFLTVFGTCTDHAKQRLIDEFNLVKSLDSSHQLIVTRSNNAVPSWPVGEPRSDINGASIYKRVWDATLTKRYFEYPVPAWFYAFLAGGSELTTDRNAFIHELQTESWMPNNGKFAMNDINSIPEQNKSLDAKRLADRFEYAEATGAKTIDLWGVEWWYWRKSIGDPSLWDTAKQKVQESKKNNN